MVIMQTGAEELKKKYTFNRSIGMTMAAGIFVYAVAVEVIKRRFAPFEGFSPVEDIHILRYSFLAVGFIIFFLIGRVNRFILSGKPQIGASGQTHDIQRLSAASMISFALSESVAIFGLVLFLLNGNPKDFYAFFIMSLLCFGRYFPRYYQWEQYVK